MRWFDKAGLVVLAAAVLSLAVTRASEAYILWWWVYR